MFRPPTRVLGHGSIDLAADAHSCLGIPEPPEDRRRPTVAGPALHLDQEPGGVGSVGVDICQDVDAAPAGGFNEVDGSPLLGPVDLPGRLEMGDLHPHASASPDLDGLRHGRKDLRLLVANVGSVQATASGHRSSHLDDLGCGREAAGHILKTGGEAEGPLVEPDLQGTDHAA